MDSLARLPTEVLEQVFDHLDNPSKCRFYATFAPHAVTDVVATLLRDEDIPVKSGLVFDDDPEFISYETLAKLPFGRAKVGFEPNHWPAVAAKLNEANSRRLSVYVRYDPGTMVYDGKPPKWSLYHGDVEVVEAEEWDFDLPKTIRKLTIKYKEIQSHRAFEGLNHLEEITFVECGYNGLQPLKLPPLVRKVYGDFHDRDFDSLVLKDTERAGEIPDRDYLPNLEHMHISQRGFRRCFHNIDCPQLTKVTLSLPEAVETLFTDEQMARLTEISLIEGASIADLAPFTLLRKLTLTLTKPLTADWSLPNLLTDLAVTTAFPIKSIPSQITHFECTTTTPDAEVRLCSRQLRHLKLHGESPMYVYCPSLDYLLLDNDVIIKALAVPQLRQLDTNWDQYSLVRFDLPNLKNLQISQPYYSYDAVDVIIPQRLEAVGISGLTIRDLFVNADEVKFGGTRIERNLSIDGRYVSFWRSSFPKESVKRIQCREFFCCTDDAIPSLVQKLIILNKNEDLEIHANTFSHCYQLEHLEIVKAVITSSIRKPVKIPETVRFLSVRHSITEEVWLELSQPPSQVSVAFSDCKGQVILNKAGGTWIKYATGLGQGLFMDGLNSSAIIEITPPTSS